MQFSGQNITGTYIPGSVITGYPIPFYQWVHVCYAITLSYTSLYIFSSQASITTASIALPYSPVNLVLDIEDCSLRDIYLIASADPSPLSNFSIYMTKQNYPSYFKVPEVVAYIPCMSLSPSLSIIIFSKANAGFSIQGVLPLTQPHNDPSILI